MDPKELIKQINDMAGMKDAAGNYNRLKPQVEPVDDGSQPYRDSKSKKTVDCEGFEVHRDEQGYIIPEDIDEILARAYKNGASDIHITVGAPPKMRVDGELLQMDYQFLTPEVTKKLLSRLVKDDVKEIFEEEGDLDFAHTVQGISRFRVNFFKERGNWSAVFRSLSTKIPDARKLGIPEAVMEMATRKRGLVLVTGPTGSGKSTTLAAIIDAINRTRRENIITLEDPIEYLHKHKLSNVNQREVGSDTKSFAAAVRAALREDPDVILIGEMRDPETIATAITAAETGHLVFSTLHTIGAAATVDRIIDSFPAEQHSQMRAQLSSVMECVVSQQLIPLIEGKGRTAVYEIMLGNVAIKNLIRENKVNMITSQIQTNMKNGMILMDESIMRAYKAGKISREKAIEFAVDKPGMMQKI